MTRSPAGAGRFVLAIVVSACGGEDSAGESVVRMDSAGIEVVDNLGEDRPLGVEFTRTLVLGGAESGPEAFFQVQRNGLALDDMGRIYILDTGNKVVRVFDERGAHLRSFGQEGEGPGEFTYPVSLMVESPGEITVRDVLKRALITFDSSGTYVGETAMPSGVYGGVYADDSTRVFGIRARDGSHLQIRRVTTSDSMVIMELPLPLTRSFRYESCGIAISLPPVFADPPSWAMGGGRVIVGTAPNYELKIFDEGRQVMSWRRDLEAELATEDHVAREIGEGEEWTIGGSQACTVPLAEVLEKRGVAERVPLIDRVAVSPDGGAWIQRERIGDDAGPIDIFDPDGVYLGTLPEHAPWPVAFGPAGRFLSLAESEVGVQYVSVYDLVGG